MEFQPVKASDKAVIDRYMKKANSRSCDMSFAAVYLWKDFYLLEYTVCEDMLIFRTTEEGSSYSFDRMRILELQSLGISRNTAKQMKRF